MLLSLGWAGVAQAQLNSSARVIAISSTTVQVSSTAGFTANSRALIVQMNGASVSRNDDATHGDIAAYNSAGRFEYVKVVGVSGGTLTLETAPTVAFDTSAAVQIVNVLVFDGNVSVGGTVTPASWNGQTGGVLAFDVVGTLTLDADIDASGRGFTGGALAANTPFDSCGSDQTNYTGAVQAGTGNKGEGIVVSSSTHAARRGHNANGGGGGNITDAGGGGGGNVGAGGLGGRELSLCDDGHFGGLGGQALDYSPNNRLFMGGGGGSGSEVSQTATGGSRAGGGMIFVRVGTLVGAGGRFLSDGLSAAQDDANGADGGGAGGSIVLSVVNSVSGSPVFRVAGGDGGDEANTEFAHGTGGGGGGGAIRLFGTSCAAITPVVNGGSAGTSALGADAGDPNWGAIDGDPGNCQGSFSTVGQPTPISAARLNVMKSSSVYTGSGASTGFSIPGEDIVYTIVVQNVGDGPAGADSVLLFDALPSNLTFFNGDIDDGGPDMFPGSDPIAFVDNGSGLSVNYTNDVAFSNQPSMPISFSSCNYTPSSGYDPAVTYICINPKGVFATPSPTSEFTIALRARID